MDMYGLSFELSGLTLRNRALQSPTYSRRELVSASAEPHVVFNQQFPLDPRSELVCE
jgi:hypothetical protein